MEQNVKTIQILCGSRLGALDETRSTFARFWVNVGILSNVKCEMKR